MIQIGFAAMLISFSSNLNAYDLYISCGMFFSDEENKAVYKMGSVRMQLPKKGYRDLLNLQTRNLAEGKNTKCYMQKIRDYFGVKIIYNNSLSISRKRSRNTYGTPFNKTLKFGKDFVQNQNKCLKQIMNKNKKLNPIYIYKHGPKTKNMNRVNKKLKISDELRVKYHNQSEYLTDVTDLWQNNLKLSDTPNANTISAFRCSSKKGDKDIQRQLTVFKERLEEFVIPVSFPGVAARACFKKIVDSSYPRAINKNDGVKYFEKVFNYLEKKHGDLETACSEAENVVSKLELDLREYTVRFKVNIGVSSKILKKAYRLRWEMLLPMYSKIYKSEEKVFKKDADNNPDPSYSLSKSEKVTCVDAFVAHRKFFKQQYVFFSEKRQKGYISNLIDYWGCKRLLFITFKRAMEDNWSLYFDNLMYKKNFVVENYPEKVAPKISLYAPIRIFLIPKGKMVSSGATNKQLLKLATNSFIIVPYHVPRAKYFEPKDDINNPGGYVVSFKISGLVNEGKGCFSSSSDYKKDKGKNQLLGCLKKNIMKDIGKKNLNNLYVKGITAASKFETIKAAAAGYYKYGIVRIYFPPDKIGLKDFHKIKYKP